MHHIDESIAVEIEIHQMLFAIVHNSFRMFYVKFSNRFIFLSFLLFVLVFLFSRFISFCHVILFAKGTDSVLLFDLLFRNSCCPFHFNFEVLKYHENAVYDEYGCGLCLALKIIVIFLKKFNASRMNANGALMKSSNRRWWFFCFWYTFFTFIIFTPSDTVK